MTGNHGKKTEDEVRAFRALADRNTTEFLEEALDRHADGVPEYVQAIREVLAEREAKKA